MRDRAAGPRGPGELDVVDLGDERGTGLARAGDAVEHVGSADLAPAVDRPARRGRRQLGGLDDDRRPGGERRDAVGQRDQQGEVPRADHADDRVGAQAHGQPLGGGEQAVRSRVRVGERARGGARAVADQVQREGHLERRLCPWLAGLGLQQRRELLLVLLEPLGVPPQPGTALARADRLPLGLRGTRGGGDRTDGRRRHVEAGCGRRHGHRAPRRTSRPGRRRRPGSPRGKSGATPARGFRWTRSCVKRARRHRGRLSGGRQRFTQRSASDEVGHERVEALGVLDHRAVAGVVPDERRGARDQPLVGADPSDAAAGGPCDPRESGSGSAPLGARVRAS